MGREQKRRTQSREGWQQEPLCWKLAQGSLQPYMQEYQAITNMMKKATGDRNMYTFFIESQGILNGLLAECRHYTSGSMVTFGTKPIRKHKD